MQGEINNIFGHYEFSVSEESSTKFLNICLQNHYTYRNMHVTDDGRLHFTCSIFIAWRLLESCKESGITLSKEGQRGIAFFLSRYKKRYGIIVGIGLVFCILFYSSNVVWDIRVEGNNTLAEEDIVLLLDCCGLYEGIKRNDYNTDQIEMRAMIQCPTITWMAITRRGTVINVQIREKEVLPERDSGTRPANLIASIDAQISLLEVYRGKPMVKIGQVVKKGDLLVSGVYDSATIGYRFTRSTGKVYAHTIRNFDIEIPYSHEVKKYDSEILIGRTLKIFKKEINIYKNSGNFGVFCDTIKSEKELAFKENEKLPMLITNTYVLTYEALTVLRTEDEAFSLAKVEFSNYLYENFTDAELFDYSYTTEITEKTLILHCTVHATENIAIMQEFDVELK